MTELTAGTLATEFSAPAPAVLPQPSVVTPDSDAVLIFIDHPDYGSVPMESVLSAVRPSLIYEAWRILDGAAITGAGVRYAGIEYLPDPPEAMRKWVS